VKLILKGMERIGTERNGLEGIGLERKGGDRTGKEWKGELKNETNRSTN